MNTRTPPWQSWLSSFLSLVLLFGSLASTATAQKKERKPVVISFGQPNIWSLEQAHYLLARMHAQNLDLKAKDVAQNELDPNAVNATRINILKSLLEINAQFDEASRFQNEQIVRNQRFNQDRRFELTTKRDNLRDTSLQLSRDISNLQFERAKMEKEKAAKEELDLKDAEIKQKQADKAAVDQEIAFYNDELKTLGAAPSGTPQAPSLSGTPFDKTKLPASVLDEVVKDDVKKLLDAAHDPRLDASTVLDNHIQMQYEIIAKQLTLLRDEVGPGERLVFLELPQSVYTTPGSGDEKMAQSWWHVNGYTKTDPLVRYLLELYEIEVRWQQIQRVPAFLRIALDKNLPIPNCLKNSDAAKNVSKVTSKERDEQNYKELSAMFAEFQKEHETARKKALNSLFKEGDSTFARVEQRGARDTSELVEAIRKKISVKTETIPFAEDGSNTQKNKETQNRRVVDLNSSTVAGQKEVVSAASARDKKQNDDIKTLKSKLLMLLGDNPPEICEPFEYNFASGIEYVRSDDQAGLSVASAVRDIERRTVRTVDIIPRQSSLNINDIQETVKATGILAAFKFLFGFAGQVNYQRQREQYEQFLHQELYASGFGKGNRDFGWTFGALPGTRRVAPGVRTTYAALVVPDDAESIVLSARGCYFPRKGYQPLDYDDGADKDWDDPGKFGRYNCGDAQTYIIPIPGGGDSNSFWVTNVDYQQVTKTDKNEGQRAVVSIRGNNFSSQIGVLVDGVSLRPSVGLAQPLLVSDDHCKGVTNAVCGYFERIDPEQIVISFARPGTGMPTITLVGPGKSVDLNPLMLTINGTRGLSLGNAKTPPIFKEPDKPTVSDDDKKKLGITSFSVFLVNPSKRQAYAVLNGANFTSETRVFVNGKELGEKPNNETVENAQPPATGRKRGGKRPPPPNPPPPTDYKQFVSPKIFRLVFDLPPGDGLTVTMMKGDEVKSATAENPLALKITKISTVSYDAGDSKSKAVLVIKIEGAGFGPSLLLGVDGASKESRLLDVSSDEAIVKLVAPESSVTLTLTNPESGESTRTVVTPQPSASPTPPK